MKRLFSLFKKPKPSTENRPKLLAIIGPTASGKTILAIKFAKEFNGEIISADSRQVYREMNIGTAKPDANQLSAIKHHLIDIKNPDEEYTVQEYKIDCLRAIAGINKKNKLPILVGGTGLYVKAVTENLQIPTIEPDPKLREKLGEEMKTKGIEHLYKKLISLDPEASFVVDGKNPRRVIRALEVTLLSHHPFTEQRTQGDPLFSTLKIGINLPLDILKENINKRIDEMIRKGLINEVKGLLRKYPYDILAFNAIGYKEIIEYLNEKVSLEEAISAAKAKTWQFARRQQTWFRADEQIHWISDEGSTYELLRRFLRGEVIK